MPTFFEGLKRLVTGEPVFKPGEDVDGVEYKADQKAAVAESAGAGAEDSYGTKVIPEVVIRKVENRNSGDNMEVTIEVINNSTTDVLIDKVLLLGTTYNLNHVLRPGEAREFIVFNGPRPNHRNYTDCELQYRDEATGDYFSSSHFVEYEQEADDTYIINRIRFVPPVKDI